jgi:predicted permease
VIPHPLGTTLHDLRDAFRSLRAAPLVSFFAVLSLSLGIGSSVAVFSVANALLLKALPVHEPERLALVASSGDGRRSYWATHAAWEQIRDRRLFENSFAWSQKKLDLSERGESELVDALLASEDLHDVLGVHPILGRGLTVGDESVAILSHEFWMRRYGGSGDVLGQTVGLDREPFTVIGVAPEGFFGPEVGSRFDVIVPLSAESRFDSPFNQWLQILGRLEPGATFESATLALRTIQPRVRELTLPEYRRAQDREAYMREPLTAVPAGRGVSFLRDRYRSPLAALMAVIGLVLLSACGNAAHLLLARVSSRRPELAIRSALGASRYRIVRNLFAESLLISGAAAVVGLFLGHWTSLLLVRQLSTELYAVFLEVPLDARVVLFTSATGILTALFFGVAPAWRGARAAPMDWHREPSPGKRLGASGALLFAQVAISLLILSTAGLFFRTFVAFASLALGFEPERVLLVDVDSRRGGPGSQERALAAVRSLPEVESAAASFAAPIVFRAMTADIDAPALPEADRVSHKNLITPDWFRTFGTGLLVGRDFESGDREGEGRVAIVNRTFARRFLEGRDPIGVVVRETSGTELRIVGLVEDAVYRSVREPPPPTIYLPLAQEPSDAPVFNLVVRPRAGSPSLLSRRVAEAIADVDPDLSLTLRPMDRQVGATFNQERVLAVLAAVLGAQALVLACLGLYGVTAHAVGRRRREIAIRMSLGADRRRVTRAVTEQVALLVAAGLAAGTALALWAAPLVRSLLFGIEPRDPSTFALAAALLTAVAVAAAYFPARRAASMDPASLLRE